MIATALQKRERLQGFSAIMFGTSHCIQMVSAHRLISLSCKELSTSAARRVCIVHFSTQSRQMTGLFCLLPPSDSASAAIVWIENLRVQHAHGNFGQKNISLHCSSRSQLPLWTPRQTVSRRSICESKISKCGRRRNQEVAQEDQGHRKSQ